MTPEEFLVIFFIIINALIYRLWWRGRQVAVNTSYRFEREIESKDEAIRYLKRSLLELEEINNGLRSQVTKSMERNRRQH